MEQQKGSTSKEMIWALRWSVALRTFYRQILSLLYSSFPFGNFRPRLVRALLVYNIIIHEYDVDGIPMNFPKTYAEFKMQACWISWRAAAEAFLLEHETYLRNSVCHLCSVFSWDTLSHIYLLDVWLFLDHSHADSYSVLQCHVMYKTWNKASV